MKDATGNRLLRLCKSRSRLSSSPLDLRSGYPTTEARSLSSLHALFDLTGRTVVRLIEQRFGAGRHLIRWEAKDDRGIRLPSGTYLCRLQTSHDDEATRVMTVG